MPRELTTDLSVLERLVAPSAKDVLDIGCGGGSLVRELSALGARVTGLEISEAQLTEARRRDSGAMARYRVGRAEALPLADASVDLAVFMRALHHVAPEALLPALREARRVLRPGGVVYVAEPLAKGDYFVLTRLVEDELEVRRAVQRALGRADLAGLDRAETVDYAVRLRVAGLDELRRRVVSVDPVRAEVFDAHEGELAAAFARLGAVGEAPGERCFIQPMRADVLRIAS